MRTNPNEDQVKDKIKIERSEYNPVPLYRSYGVTSKERPLLTKIKVIIQKATATFVFGVPILVAAVGILSFIIAGTVLVRTAILLPLGIFIILRLTKTLRKRLKLIRSLKRLCKKHGYKYGYKLEMNANPLSPKWTNGRGKLIFHTNTKVYHVAIFAIRKYRSKLQFESDTEMTLIKPPLRNKFTAIYDFRTKYKKLNIDFSGVAETAGKETVKAVVICPTCEEWSYRYSATSYVPTGNAETVFGYKAYTASGFIKDLRRSEEE